MALVVLHHGPVVGHLLTATLLQRVVVAGKCLSQGFRPLCPYQQTGKIIECIALVVLDSGPGGRSNIMTVLKKGRVVAENGFVEQLRMSRTTQKLSQLAERNSFAVLRPGPVEGRCLAGIESKRCIE